MAAAVVLGAVGNVAGTALATLTAIRALLQSLTSTESPIPAPPHASSSAALNDQHHLLYVDEAKLVGVDGEADRIAQWLTSTEHDKILCIVGPGGIGKTTLAKMVYQRLAAKFFRRAAVSASGRSFDTENAARQLLAQLFGDDEEDEDFTESYLVFIDDLLTTTAWDSLQSALPQCTQGNRRVIIVTTRKEEVAKHCCDEEGVVYKPSPLNDDDIRSFFSSRVFGSPDGCPANLMEVSRSILRHCNGLPLAVIAVSGLLKGKKAQWEAVLRSLSSELIQNPASGVLKAILSVSYTGLPNYLKSCVLYLSSFPPGAEIARDRLVRQWVALDHAAARSGLTAEEIGDGYFDELVDRGIVLPVGVRYDGRAAACRVHDAMLELIVQKATRYNFITVVAGDRHPPLTANSDISRLSLQHCSTAGAQALHPLSSKRCRSLTMFECLDMIPLDLSKFQALRVLELSRSKGFDAADGICGLINLRYLGLESTDIAALPEQIDSLKSLTTLDIGRTKIAELPERLVHLPNLTHLVHRSSNCTLHLPDGISNLKSLQTVTGFAVAGISSAVQQLAELSSLTKLDITGEEMNIAMVSTLHSLLQQNLRQLSFGVTGNTPMVFLHSMPELPSPVPLRRLRLTGVLWKIPRWFEALANLEDLELRALDLGDDDLQIIGQLPRLARLQLKLHKCEPVAVKKRHGFQTLAQLFVTVVQKNRLPAVAFEEGAMARLEVLFLMLVWERRGRRRHCSGIGSLRSLKEIAVGEFEEGQAEAEVAAIEREAAAGVAGHGRRRPRLVVLRNVEEVTEYRRMRAADDEF